MSDLEPRLLEAIRTTPGVRAIDLAVMLGVEKSVVNAALFGPLKHQVRQDRRYRWYPASPFGAASPERAAATQHSPLARLSRYYLDCLSHDDLGGVSVFADSSAASRNYIELPSLPGFPPPPGAEPLPSDPRRLLSRANTADKRQTLLIGYPIRLKAVASRKSDWKGYKVEPLFLFALHQEDGREVTTAFAPEPPQINFEALKSLAGATDYGLMDEAILLADQLGISAAEGDRPELDELFARLRSIRPDWDWREDIDPGALSQGDPIAKLTAQGIYNRAVIVATERSPYTKGLESDLAQLQTVSADGSALGDWLSGKEIQSQVANETPLIEVLPLNTEQRQAVRQALTNPLTVITGPPGTGKSQVVTSILINATWQGQRVLFASKNNKAVDVVETRVNALSARPVLLRLGAAEHQTKMAEYLTGLLATTVTESEQQQHQQARDRHRQLQREADALDAELEAYIRLRNAVDHAEQSAEPLRLALGDDVFTRLRRTDPDTVRSAASRLRTRITAATRRDQAPLTRLLWPLIKQGRYRALDEAANAFVHTAESIALPMPTGPCADDRIAEWTQYAERLADRIKDSAALANYSRLLDSLTNSRSLEAISAARIAVTQRISEHSGALWDGWLRLIPARLSHEDRQAVGNLSSILQLIVSSNAEKRPIRRDVFQRYYELFPKVSSVLPCWAVTSLSARGRIPFEPGFVDLLVIDEASQCDIASVIPLLFRARRVVVIGDPKQLRHISQLSRPQDQQLLAKHDLLTDHPAWAYSTQSLFDLAVTRCRSSDIVVLRDHHRSHADIIGFSNSAFYDGALRVATRHDRLRRPSLSEPAVRWQDVRGRTVRPPNGGAMNEVEAAAVVAEIRRLVDQDYQGSIGVVSPFRAQATRIRDMVGQDERLSRRLASSDFLVDTVHKFQGDERDVMLFSPVVSQGASDSALQFLRGNGNLFNVAVTRARAALVVIGDQEAALNSNVDYLARFATHCDTVRRGAPSIADAGRTDFGPEYPVLGRSDRISEWERVFYRAAYAQGIKLIPQYPVDKYFLDFALIVGDRRLNIEIDGEHYHRDWDGELCRRDQIRNQRMIELGWDVMRFWVYQVRDGMEGCLGRVRGWSASPQRGD